MLDLPAILALARAQASLADAATPGPWSRIDPPWGNKTVVMTGDGDPHGAAGVCDCDVDWMGDAEPGEVDYAPANSAFIAAARSAVPEMAWHIEELVQEVERLRKALGFYARHEHWMAVASDADCARQLLVALSGQLPPDGWAVAEDALK